MKKYLKLLIIITLVLLINITIVKAVGSDVPSLDITGEPMTCKEIVGPNFVKLIQFCITTIKIAATIIAIVNGMLIMIPPITSKNYDALNEALKKVIRMLIILAIILVLPVIIRVIGTMFDFDLSCIF